MPAQWYFSLRDEGNTLMEIFMAVALGTGQSRKNKRQTQERMDQAVRRAAWRRDGAEMMEMLEQRVMLSALPMAQINPGFSVGLMLADPVRNDVYLVDKTNNQLVVMDTDLGRAVAFVKLTGTASGLAISPDDAELYVASTSANTIQVFSLANNMMLLRTLNAATPDQIAVGSGSRLFVSSNAYVGVSVRELDAKNGAALTSFGSYYSPILRTNVTGTTLYVTDLQFNPTTTDAYDISNPAAVPGKVGSYGTNMQNGRDLAVDDQYHRLYAMSGGVYGVYAVDMTARTGQLWSFAGAAYGTSVDVSGTVPYIYAGSQDPYNGGIFYYDRSSGALLGSYKPVGQYKAVWDLAVTPNGHVLFEADPTYSVVGPYQLGIIGVSSLNVGNFQSPILNLSGLNTAYEGSSYSLAFSASDPNIGATLTGWTINWGDNTTTTLPGTATSATHTFVDGPSSPQIKVTVSDSVGASQTGTFPITVNDLTPVLNVGGLSTVYNNQGTVLTLAVSDPGTLDSVTVDVDWGDGTAHSGAVFTAPTSILKTSNVGHTYVANGSYTQVITATDKDGARISTTRVVNVSAPVLVPTAASIKVTEGSAFSGVVGSFADPGYGALSLYSATIVWGDGHTSAGTIQTTAAANVFNIVGTNTYANEGSYPISIAVKRTGTSGITVNSTANVAVVPPMLALSGAASANEGSTYTLGLSGTEAGTDVITGWKINWGDGTPVQNVAGNPPSVTHVYADGPSKATITATATDEDGTWDATRTAGTLMVDFGGGAGFASAPIPAGYTLGTSKDGVELANGKIVMIASGDNAAHTSTITALIRYNADGTLDTTFGNGGIVIAQLPGTTFTAGKSIKVDAGGNLIVLGMAGSSGNFVARYSSDGAILGSIIIPSTKMDFASDFAFDAQQRIYVVGRGAGDFMCARLTPGLAFDTTWGGAGYVAADFGTTQDTALGVATAPDGRIAAYGWTRNSVSMDVAALAVWKSDGTLDTSFGGTGKVVTDNGYYQDGTAIAWLSDGRLLGGSVAYPDSQSLAGFYSLTQYNANGTKDTTFGTGGTTIINPTAHFTDYLEDMKIDRDGRIVLAGRAWDSGGVSQPVFARLLANGALDTAFGVGGVAAYSVAGDLRSFVIGRDNNLLGFGNGAANNALVLKVSQGPMVVTVANVMPVATITGGAAGTTSPEGVALTYQAVVQDGAGDLPTMAYAWTVTKNGAALASGTAATLAFTPDDNGTYVVSLTAKDKDGGVSAAATKTVTVTNVAPTAVFAATGPANEGGTGTVAFTNLVDVAKDVAAGFTYRYDFNNDGVFDLVTTAASATVPASIVGDGPATRIIRGRITDKDGGFSDYTTTLTVTNVAPVATISGPATGKRNKASTFTLLASDPSAADQSAGFTFGIDWNGDGVIDQTIKGVSGLKVSHTFKNAGTYLVKVYATDKDGTVSAVSTLQVVIS